MTKAKKFSGINIQYPISKLIMTGEKTIETRTYPMPKQFTGEAVILVETPGSLGTFKARMVAIIKFGESFQYMSAKAFYEDQEHHCVSKDSVWAWDKEKQKWGWPILSVDIFTKPIPAPFKKGIKYTNDILLPKNVAFLKK